MPGQTRTPTVEPPAPSAPEQAAAAPAAGAPAQEAGNAAEQEKLRGKEGTDAGLANYQQSLGNWLGGELYKAVAPHLTFEAMQKVANQGLEGALEGGVGLLGGLEGQVDKAAVGAFGKALAAQYGSLAGEWLDTDGGRKLTGGLADWVDAHPRLIVLTALLAAAGAVLANMDIPTIKQKFKIAKGLNAEVEAELGKLRAWALEEIKAKLSYESGPLLAAVQVSHDGEKGNTDVKAELGVSEKDSYSAKANVQFTQDGFKAWGADASLNTSHGTVGGEVAQDKDKDPVVKGSLTRKDGTTTVVNKVGYDANSKVFTFEDTRNFLLEGGTKVDTTQKAGSDGSNELGAGFSAQVSPELSAKGGFEHKTTVAGGKPTTTDSVSGGLAYDNKKDLSWGVDGKLGGDGSGSLSGNAKWKPSENWTLEGNGSASWGGDKDRFGLGASAMFQDSDTKLRLGAAYASEDQKFSLNAMAQQNLTQNFALQGNVGFESSNKGNALNAGLHGAYTLDKDVAVIAGGRYQLDTQGQSHFIPEVGAQVKGVPLTIGYDTQTKGFVVGASIKF